VTSPRGKHRRSSSLPVQWPTGGASRVNTLISRHRQPSAAREEFADFLIEYKNKDRKTAWDAYFDTREIKPDTTFLAFRAYGHGGCDTRFMLRLYLNNLLMLNALGRELPYGLTQDKVWEIREEHTNTNK